MRMKKNKYKQKKGWCTSKEKNIKNINVTSSFNGEN